MESKINDALNRLSQLTDRPMHEFRDAIIEEMCNVTGSEIAYFYAADLSEAYLTLLGYSKSVMENCQIAGGRPATYKVSETGLWGDAVRERGPVIENDYAHSQRASKRGYPQGHVAVTRHMNLPIFDEGRIVAIVGVGNKKDPYTMDDAEHLEALMNGVWREFQEALWQAVW